MSDIQVTMVVNEVITQDVLLSWEPERIDAFLDGIRSVLLARRGGEHLKHLLASPPPWRTSVATPVPASGVVPDPEPSAPVVPVEPTAIEPPPPPPPPPPEDPAPPAPPPAAVAPAITENGEERDPPPAEVPPPEPTAAMVEAFLERADETTTARFTRLIQEGSVSTADFVAPCLPTKGFHIFGRIRKLSDSAGFGRPILVSHQSRISLIPEVVELFRAVLGDRPGQEPAPPSPPPPPPDPPAVPPTEAEPPKVRAQPPIPVAQSLIPRVAPAADTPEPAGPPATDADATTHWSRESLKIFEQRLKDADPQAKGLVRTLYASSSAVVLSDAVRTPASAVSMLETCRRGLGKVVIANDGMAYLDYGFRIAYAAEHSPLDIPWIRAVGQRMYQKKMRDGDRGLRLHEPD